MFPGSIPRSIPPQGMPRGPTTTARAQAAYLHKWGTLHSPGHCQFGPAVGGVLSALPLLSPSCLAESLSWIKVCEEE